MCNDILFNDVLFNDIYLTDDRITTRKTWPTSRRRSWRGATSTATARSRRRSWPWSSSPSPSKVQKIKKNENQKKILKLLVFLICLFIVQHLYIYVQLLNFGNYNMFIIGDLWRHLWFSSKVDFLLKLYAFTLNYLKYYELLITKYPSYQIQFIRHYLKANFWYNLTFLILFQLFISFEAQQTTAFCFPDSIYLESILIILSLNLGSYS